MSAAEKTSPPDAPSAPASGGEHHVERAVEWDELLASKTPAERARLRDAVQAELVEVLDGLEGLPDDEETDRG